MLIFFYGWKCFHFMSLSRFSTKSNSDSSNNQFLLVIQLIVDGRDFKIFFWKIYVKNRYYIKKISSQRWSSAPIEPLHLQQNWKSGVEISDRHPKALPISSQNFPLLNHKMQTRWDYTGSGSLSTADFVLVLLNIDSSAC